MFWITILVWINVICCFSSKGISRKKTFLTIAYILTMFQLLWLASHGFNHVPIKF